MLFWKRSMQDAVDTVVDCPAQSFVLPYIIIISIIGGVFLLVLAILNILLLPKQRDRTKILQDELLKHALITGGSSGIGFAIARDLVGRGCKYITLVALDDGKLDEVKKVLEEDSSSLGTETVISIIPLDVTESEKISDVATKVCSSDSGAPTMLFNVAGTSIARSFLNLDYKEFEKMMNINYLGSVYTTRAFLPFMISPLKLPRAVIFTCSQAGQVGVFGYTAYSASKFALRGLAEALHMEVAPENVNVQLVFPPDTETPGFHLEQIGKPEETKKISETSGLFQPESVAKTIVSSALKRRPPFSVHFGLEGWMLSTLTAGMSPVQTNVNAMCQIFLMGLLRFVSMFYLMDFRRIVSKVGMQRKKTPEDTEVAQFSMNP